MKTPPQAAKQPLALAYVRVSTAEQVETGASLDAQRATLVVEAERRGWAVEVVADEGKSAKSLNRPGLQSALVRLDAGQADFLMAIRLDRVSRSVSDFAGLLDRAAKKGWDLALLSPNIDTSDPAGRFTANVLASAAQYERELIGVRTREGMAQRRSEGVRLGRPRTTPAEAVARANNTPYGLSAGIWTEKGSRILWMADRLRAGVIWANTFNRFDPTSPFGGYQESGYGREGGRHGLAAYLKGAGL